MNLIKVDETNKALFRAYCQEYRYEHDESYLDDEELEGLNPNVQPTFIIQEKDHSVIGAVSLKIFPYLENEKRGRLAILHVIESCSFIEEAYKRLVNSIKPYIKDLNHISCFVPESKTTFREIIQGIGFTLERYIWVLVRDNMEVSAPQLPPGMILTSVQTSEDVKDWCSVRNEAFKTVQGNETPITAEKALEMLNESRAIPGGMLLLKDGDYPVGAIRITKELDEGKEYTFIGSVSVLPHYRGKGLGRFLLRAGLTFGKNAGLGCAMLTVNAQNENAARLYVSEGFHKLSVVICYVFS